MSHPASLNMVIIVICNSKWEHHSITNQNDDLLVTSRHLVYTYFFRLVQIGNIKSIVFKSSVT